ncbi:MAG: histidine triad nucleotide-binding protein [Oscillospiraceae bacterium]|jgi:histidine triad (HIT) family protein|nr:histidine triad nucleotide-binding protein [Oscillospiraceae bacterium]
MNDCLFCKIIAGEIPSKKVYEDESCYAFYDIDPKAPVHFLVVPKTHISGPDAVEDENAALVGHIYAVIAKVTRELGLSKGYRVVANCGEDGGQTVGHLHFHVLAGRTLAWPPG